MDEKILKALGLDPKASIDQVLKKITSLKADNSELRSSISALRTSLEDTEKDLKSVLGNSREARVKDLVRKAQDETGRYVSEKDALEKMEKKATVMLGSESEEDTEMFYEDLKNMCFAYGVAINLSSMLDGGRKNGELSDEKKVEMLVKRSKENGAEMSLIEASRIVSTGKYEEKIQEFN
jgi:hypothetical protein